jgi:putative ABC transport system permease protein
MFTNYLIVTLRRLQRHLGYSTLNVAGLAVGLATCLVIALFIHHEWSYDRFHPAADRVMRVLVESGEDGDRSLSLPAALPQRLRRSLPAVEAAASLTSVDEVLIASDDAMFYEEDGVRANAGFFRVFSGFTALHGNLATALDQPGAIVLTRSMAEKYFGTTDAVGRTLTTRDEQRIDPVAWRERSAYSVEILDETPYTVTAVIEAPPSNSSVKFDFVMAQRAEVLDVWNIRGTRGYVLLGEQTARDEAARKALSATMTSVLARYDSDSAQESAVHLQPLTDVHLDPAVGGDGRTGPRQYLMMFALAALLVLGIACVNYMNLATARAADRAREVGVRKSIGADRRAIAQQFLGESFLFAGLSVGCALLLAQAALPLFSRILGVELSLTTLVTPGAVALLLGGTMVVGLVAGGYPAFVLSRFQPTRVLKAQTTPSTGSASLRRALVVFQFAASIGLILATVVVYQQMEFVRAERLNTQGEEVLAVSNRSEVLAEGRYAALKQRLLAEPSVSHVATGQMPGRVYLRTSTSIDTTGRFDMLGLLVVGDDYLETLGIDVVTGQGFADAAATRSSLRGTSLINETAARLAGYTADSLGRSGSPFNSSTVVGIVEDFHASSLFEPIMPVALLHTESVQDRVLVRLREGQTAEGLAAVQAAWADLVPDRPMQYAFVDEALDEMYRAELRLGQLFGVFAVIAIVIACLGLLGLSAYVVRRRAKEISIRKVLGASSRRIVAMLSREFVGLVALAFVVGAPLAYGGMQRWLTDFAYRVELDLGLFVGVGGLALSATLLTVGYHALRAARVDPAEVLRSE